MLTIKQESSQKLQGPDIDLAFALLSLLTFCLHFEQSAERNLNF